jgi:hypothetical protein
MDSFGSLNTSINEFFDANISHISLRGTNNTRMTKGDEDFEQILKEL